ncbi:MAG: S41 family peptidase [Pirellulales bacterium]|nr:S41 family peptidase [Pirellulales bacterium]
MPRRNIQLLFLLGFFAVACHIRADRASQVLAYVLGEIQQRYVTEVDESVLFEGAMEGMVQRLDQEYNDRNSAYITPAEAQAFEEELSKEFIGVGIEVNMPEATRQITVVSPLFGSPACEAGVRAGDRIVKIDGKSTQGLSLEDAVERMRGPRGTPVTLTVIHPGEKKPIDLTIVREMVHSDTVRGDTRNPDGSWNYFLEGHDRIGYLRIVAFTNNTPSEMRKAIGWLLEHNMQGLVLDLRQNPGGMFDEAVQICDMFVSSGVIVTTRRRGKICDTYRAHAADTFPDFPMAVLVDQHSASASEILAACLQDAGRAVIVGQQSYGKGTVQEVLGLPKDHGILKLTVANYWRPSGKNINRDWRDKNATEWGVRPDPGYEVVVEGDALRDWVLARARRDGYRPTGDTPSPDTTLVDPPRDKAVEYVESRSNSLKNQTPPAPAAD